MGFPKWLQGVLDSDGKRQIEDAITLAEQRTSGEIVPIIASRSCHTSHLLGYITAVSLAIGQFCLIAGYSLGLITINASMLALIFIGSVLLAQLVHRIQFLQRLSISAIDQINQVDLRAELEFYEAGLDKTAGQTGILIFVSLMEHRAVVLADKGISEKLPPETWSGVLETLLAGIKRGHMSQGFVDAIAECGNILEQHFPPSPNDQNELRNSLIIKD